MNILAVGAHPDDLEVYCFGTLAKYIQKGHKVFTCHITCGDLGHYEIMPKELGEIRSSEAKNAAETIGAEYVGLNIGDLKVNSYDNNLRRKVIELIRNVKPDLIITHYPGVINDHPDHTETGQLVLYASFGSSVPNYKTNTEYYKPIVPVYYMESIVGVNFAPQEYVDISDFIELKLDAINCHASQKQWMEHHDDGFNMTRYAKVSGEYRECNAALNMLRALEYVITGQE